MMDDTKNENSHLEDVDEFCPNITVLGIEDKGIALIEKLIYEQKIRLQQAAVISSNKEKLLTTQVQRKLLWQNQKSESYNHAFIQIGSPDLFCVALFIEKMEDLEIALYLGECAKNKSGLSVCILSFVDNDSNKTSFLEALNNVFNVIIPVIESNIVEADSVNFSIGWIIRTIIDPIYKFGLVGMDFADLIYLMGKMGTAYTSLTKLDYIDSVDNSRSRQVTEKMLMIVSTFLKEVYVFQKQGIFC